MALLRDLPFVVPAFREKYVITCAAAGPFQSTAASTEVRFGVHLATADVIVSTGAASTWHYGDVINRLDDRFAAFYRGVAPAAYLYACVGSTEANRNLLLDVKLQHGASSAGGDMADFSTGRQPATRTWFGTNRTTDQVNWDGSLSTGALLAHSNPAYYDLTNAKQYLRMGVAVAKNRVTTETSGDELARVGGTLTFFGGDRLPEVLSTESAFSSATDT